VSGADQWQERLVLPQPVLALGGSVRGWWTYPGRGSRSPLSMLWRSFFGVKAGKVVFL
jgi:hypothetical protein